MCPFSSPIPHLHLKKTQDVDVPHFGMAMAPQQCGQIPDHNRIGLQAIL